MTPRERARRFRAQIRAQIKRRHLQVDEGVLAVLETLAELQAGIRDKLAATPTDFEAHRLPALLGEVEEQIARWRLRAVHETDRAMEMAWELGPAMVDAPLAAADIVLPRVLIATSLLEEVQRFTAGKIKDIGAQALQRIERSIRAGVLGGMTPHQVMTEIAPDLGVRGPLLFTNFRAEMVVRTEMGRLHSMAADRRLAKAAEQLPDLGKQWAWSHKSRMSHAAVDGQTRPADGTWLVGGEQMRYPRDPAASARNVVNCGCEAVPWMESWS